MITSLFRKSTPLNYSVLIIAVIVFFLGYQLHNAEPLNEIGGYLQLIVLLLTIFGSLFVVNFIVKKNSLSRDSSYVILFYLLFHLFVPDIFNNLNIVLANFFVLLAFRRLISLHSLKSAKEKIFDASLWIFVATLFHFWSILFIVLVFLSILFHVARDYRNWFLPFIAFFGIAVTFLLFALILDPSRIEFLYDSMQIEYKLDYFTSNYQNLALSIYVTITLFFVVSLILTLSNRPLMLHASYKKILIFFAIAVVIYFISPTKSNDLLLLTFAPVAMMATSHVEVTRIRWQNEVIIGSILAFAIFLYVMQL